MNLECSCKLTQLNLVNSEQVKNCRIVWPTVNLNPVNSEIQIIQTFGAVPANGLTSKSVALDTS